MVEILFVSGGVLDTLNLYWFYLMFKIVISSTPDIKPIMEKKRIDFKIATEQFQQKMVLMKNRKISAMKNTVSSSMTDIRTKLNTARDGLRLRRQ
jgi:hypothetical protein